MESPASNDVAIAAGNHRLGAELEAVSTHEGVAHTVKRSAHPLE